MPVLSILGDFSRQDGYITKQLLLELGEVSQGILGQLDDNAPK